MLDAVDNFSLYKLRCTLFLQISSKTRRFSLVCLVSQTFVTRFSFFLLPPANDRICATETMIVSTIRLASELKGYSWEKAPVPKGLVDHYLRLKLQVPREPEMAETVLCRGSGGPTQDRLFGVPLCVFVASWTRCLGVPEFLRGRVRRT